MLHFGEKIKFMLVHVLCLVEVENTIAFKDLNDYLSQAEKSCTDIKVCQNLFKYLHYSQQAGTIFRCNKKPYVICLPWSKDIYKLAILFDKASVKILQNSDNRSNLIICHSTLNRAFHILNIYNL